MRILTILQAVLVICLLSCSSQPKEECLHDSFIHEFSKAYLFFAELGNDSIIVTDNFYLHQIYKRHYLEKFPSFHMFLCSLYDNEVILDRDFLDETMLESNFMFKKEDTFDNIDLLDLKECYLVDLQYLVGDIDLSEKEKFNLLYYFFRNEYYITEDDVTGFFSIWKNEKNNFEQKR